MKVGKKGFKPKDKGKTLIDIFTILLGALSLCVLTGAVSKILFKRSKVWDEDEYFPVEMETGENYQELRKENPHIWIE